MDAASAAASSAASRPSAAARPSAVLDLEPVTSPVGANPPTRRVYQSRGRPDNSDTDTDDDGAFRKKKQKRRSDSKSLATSSAKKPKKVNTSRMSARQRREHRRRQAAEEDLRSKLERLERELQERDAREMGFEAGRIIATAEGSGPAKKKKKLDSDDWSSDSSDDDEGTGNGSKDRNTKTGAAGDAADFYWEVEAILDRRTTKTQPGGRNNRAGRRVEYKIKWKGCPESEATWEPTSNLCDSAMRSATQWWREERERIKRREEDERRLGLLPPKDDGGKKKEDSKKEEGKEKKGRGRGLSAGEEDDVEMKDTTNKDIDGAEDRGAADASDKIAAKAKTKADNDDDDDDGLTASRQQHVEGEDTTFSFTDASQVTYRPVRRISVLEPNARELVTDARVNGVPVVLVDHVGWAEFAKRWLRRRRDDGVGGANADETNAGGTAASKKEEEEESNTALLASMREEKKVDDSTVARTTQPTDRDAPTRSANPAANSARDKENGKMTNDDGRKLLDLSDPSWYLSISAMLADIGNEDVPVVRRNYDESNPITGNIPAGKFFKACWPADDDVAVGGGKDGNGIGSGGVQEEKAGAKPPNGSRGGGTTDGGKKSNGGKTNGRTREGKANGNTTNGSHAEGTGSNDSSVATPTFAVGDLVNVEPRTWPGINRPGGVGKVTRVHAVTATTHTSTDDDRAATDAIKASAKVDVKYVLGGEEKEVEVRYVRRHEDEGRKEGRKHATEGTKASSSSVATGAGTTKTTSSKQPSTSSSAAHSAARLYLHQWQFPLSATAAPKLCYQSTPLPDSILGEDLLKYWIDLPHCKYDCPLQYLFMGREETMSKLHRDPGGLAISIAPIVGKKECVLVHRSDGSNCLYHLTAPLEPGRVDLHAYPLLAQSRIWKTTIRPGEILLMPQGTYHQCRNVTPCLSYSRFHLDTVNLLPFLQSMLDGDAPELHHDEVLWNCTSEMMKVVDGIADRSRDGGAKKELDPMQRRSVDTLRSLRHIVREVARRVAVRDAVKGKGGGGRSRADNAGGGGKGDGGRSCNPSSRIEGGQHHWDTLVDDVDCTLHEFRFRFSPSPPPFRPRRLRGKKKEALEGGAAAAPGGGGGGGMSGKPGGEVDYFEDRDDVVWYTAKDNDTPKMIAAMFDVAVSEIVDFNRERLPGLIGTSRLKENTRIAVPKSTEGAPSASEAMEAEEALHEDDNRPVVAYDTDVERAYLALPKATLPTNSGTGDSKDNGKENGGGVAKVNLDELTTGSRITILLCGRCCPAEILRIEPNLSSAYLSYEEYPALYDEYQPYDRLRIPGSAGGCNEEVHPGDVRPGLVVLNKWGERREEYRAVVQRTKCHETMYSVRLDLGKCGLERWIDGTSILAVEPPKLLPKPGYLSSVDQWRQRAARQQGS